LDGWLSSGFDLLLKVALHPVSTALANAFAVVGATVGFIFTYRAGLGNPDLRQSKQGMQ
jgi:hypothetical protein